VAADSTMRDKLVQRIHGKQSEVSNYLRHVEPRSWWLMVVSIVTGGLAGLLTAAPAVGGPSFTGALTEALGTSPTQAPGWRLLCAAATVCSFVSATAMSVYRTQDLATRMAKAQVARARLESLETFLETTDLPIEKATEEYTEVLREVAFISP